MNWEEWGARLIADDGPSGPTADAARAVLAGAAHLYDIGLEAYLLAGRMGLRRRAHLPVPIISIGNLTVGGTGKTPMTQALCRALTQQGRRVAILSRGHGGRGTEPRLVSDAEGHVLLTAQDAGDEPLLLAQTLPGVPVLVGKDRRETGREALRRFGLDAVILDDGFQYWQLARDLDIVLLDARRPFDNGYPLPRGLLREPPRHLTRAGIVVVTRADALDGEGRASLRAEIARLAPQAGVYWASHGATGFVPVHSLASPALPLDTLRGARVVALSGIAQPQSFARTLTEGASVTVARHLVYSDHAEYTQADADQAQAAVLEEGADALIMTEKDAVKWPAQGSAVGAGGNSPVYSLRIELDWEDRAGFLDAVMRRVFGRA